MHHIGECLSKTQTRHILNWASVRSSSVACSTSSCVRLKILAKLLNASNILFIFLIFASISMGWLMLILVLVSLTCSVLHLQSPVHLHRRGTQCSAVQWCRSLAGGTTWQRSRSRHTEEAAAAVVLSSKRKQKSVYIGFIFTLT